MNTARLAQGKRRAEASGICWVSNVGTRGGRGRLLTPCESGSSSSMSVLTAGTRVEVRFLRRVGEMHGCMASARALPLLSPGGPDSRFFSGEPAGTDELLRGRPNADG